MSIISMVLVVFVAFLAGLEGILDQFQFHQPLVACTLIGLVTGNLAAGVMLGGSLQLIALGWANIGAAVAPDVALASVAAAIIMVLGGDFSSKGIAVAQGVAIPLAVAGLFLTMIVRTLSVGLVHGADAAAKKGDIKGVERAHFIALFMQGARIAIPAALLLMIPAESVKSALEAMPAWLSEGMQIGGGMVVAVGYAMVINMMTSPRSSAVGGRSRGYRGRRRSGSRADRPGGLRPGGPGQGPGNPPACRLRVGLPECAGHVPAHAPLRDDRGARQSLR